MRRKGLLAVLVMATCVVAILTFHRMRGRGSPKGASPGLPMYRVEMATAAIRGRAVFEGEPVIEYVDMRDASCRRVHSEPPRREDGMIVTGPSGGIRNLQVYVRRTYPPREFDYSEYLASAPAATVEMTGCVYRPHVLGVMIGQEIDFVSRDSTDHCLRVMSRLSGDFGRNQPRSPVEIRIFDTPEMGVAIACDKHSWMKAYVNVFDHPFHAVTGEDGAFEIRLPPGDYEIATWHGALPEQVRRVALRDGEVAAVEFRSR